MLAPGRVRGDRHRLDDRERVALHDHPVLERSGLGLVGVADQVVRAARLVGDGVPLAAHRERGAAAAHEVGVDHLADHAVGTQLDRAAQRLVAAVGAVVVEALRVDRPDACEQPQAALAELRRRGRRRRRRRRAAEDRPQPVGVHGRQLALQRLVAGVGQHRRRRAVALAQARAAQPRGPVDRHALRAELRDQLLGAGAAARDVVAHVHHARRPLVDREQRVERGHAVDVGGRHGQAARDVVQPAGADPARALVQRVQRGQQQVTLLARLVPAVRGVPVVDRVGPGPDGQRRAQERVDGVALRRRRLGVQQP